TNLQVFQMARWCRSHGIQCTVRRGASGEYWPGWIARLTVGFQMEMMSLKTAEERWKMIVGSRESITFDQAVEFLKAQGVVSGSKINLISLSRQILERVPDRTDTNVNEPSLTISTIHRSKGMEFDTVFLLKPSQDFIGKPEEVRVLYVA